MIFRNDKWDLPKGKLEVGENVNECAIREVEEECGVDNLVIVKTLKNTYHTYEMNGVAILKRTYWFKMKTNFTADLIPQLEEGITKVEWVSKEGISTRLENSYGNINEIFADE
jgi:8-oxo-dGTP pyrophosphatase MutT (NUDIX family)